MQQALLDWSGTRLRDLPWRRTRDPWAILVAELILQQTQVARAQERWPQFMREFPTPTACAAGGAAAVQRAWEGLGYNRRALRLHRSAVLCTDQHGGAVPDTLLELRALPGVGPYTARAVLAFAYERDVAVVDTNVGRVLARVQDTTPALVEQQALADTLVVTGQGWRWNQAMLDVGATVCTAKSPACESCPFESVCAWRQAGWPSPDPAVGAGGVAGRQSRFEGSDRQGRGRLMAALRRSEVAEDDLPDVMGWPTQAERAGAVAATLVRDGLVEHREQVFRLAD